MFSPIDNAEYSESVWFCKAVLHSKVSGHPNFDQLAKQWATNFADTDKYVWQYLKLDFPGLTKITKRDRKACARAVYARLKHDEALIIAEIILQRLCIEPGIKLADDETMRKILAHATIGDFESWTHMKPGDLKALYEDWIKGYAHK